MLRQLHQRLSKANQESIAATLVNEGFIALVDAAIELQKTRVLSIDITSEDAQVLRELTLERLQLSLYVELRALITDVVTEKNNG